MQNRMRMGMRMGTEQNGNENENENGNGNDEFCSDKESFIIYHLSSIIITKFPSEQGIINPIIVWFSKIDYYFC